MLFCCAQACKARARALLGLDTWLAGSIFHVPEGCQKCSAASPEGYDALLVGHAKLCAVFPCFGQCEPLSPALQLHTGRRMCRCTDTTTCTHTAETRITHAPASHCTRAHPFLAVGAPGCLDWLLSGSLLLMAVALSCTTRASVEKAIHGSMVWFVC